MTDNFTDVLFYGSSYTTKSGWKISLQLADEHAAKALDAAGSGKRYKMALIPIDDDETTPEPPKPKKQQLSNRAALMLQYAAFPQFVNETYDYPINHDEADGWLKDHCGVTSKREFDIEHRAGENFKAVELEWDIWSGRISGPR